MIKPRDIIITGLCVYRTHNRNAAINLSHFNMLERVMCCYKVAGLAERVACERYCDRGGKEFNAAPNFVCGYNLFSPLFKPILGSELGPTCYFALITKPNNITRYFRLISLCPNTNDSKRELNNFRHKLYAVVVSDLWLIMLCGRLKINLCFNHDFQYFNQ